ncbi:glycoside hydrolase family 3 C-terminal domain-containing protein [Actinoplanes sp. Pm04-4]|uniref:beta-N-acetylhexosaminidase n=1 Tax=Paractinoplanes pyxinae TaxID=2997416 RepID=A0ABT4B5Y4_9ACTN|nr:glycoside hydrolase family 3 protein [Actinoplanes pyxinae]MCY1141920.1 glycoside hydrolase family 3 C-terminal domain-containing protein [Actinoplanes pyxinae]
MIRRILAISSVVVLTAVSAAGPAGAQDPLGRRIAAMSLPEKVGQMIVSYVYGDSSESASAANETLFGPGVATPAQAVEKFHLGGVIYFTWSGNLSNPPQIAALSNGLQRAAMGDTGIPLQISTDQEGGTVNRIGAPLAVSPGNMAIGATFDPRTAYDAAEVSGTELRALGITVTHAPVIDVNTNPRNAADGVRAFSDRTAHVATFGVAAEQGYRAAGIGTTAKHFPGLGDTTVNTDNGVAVTNESRAEILRTHVPPFRAVIAAGAKSIMAAHIVAPALDPSGAPASLSKPIITGLLRERLGFNGVVVTDALEAAALEDYTDEEVILGAVRAGVDQLLMPRSVPGAVRILLDAVASGQLSERRIDQSVRRILKTKTTSPYVAEPPAVGTPAAVATMNRIAQRSITTLRSADLPLRPGQKVLVTGWGATTTTNLATALGATRLNTGSPTDAVIAQAVAAAQEADVTVVTTFNAWSDPTQVKLVQALLATGQPIVVAAVGTPYDLASFPAAKTFVASYGYQPPSLAALAAVLRGEAPAPGRLPVTIEGLYPYGSRGH